MRDAQAPLPRIAGRVSPERQPVPALAGTANANAGSSAEMPKTTALVDAARPKRVLILAENLPSPFDRRVWQEACALRDAGYVVSIICPTGHGYERKFEEIGGIHIYRYSLPVEASGAAGYALEYAIALASTFVLSWRVLITRGFDVIHACNPPDLFFLIGAFFKLFGKKFVFDHHDLTPELYEAKFGRRDFFHRLMLTLEYWSFRTADVSIATNESYRRIAIDRGRMQANRVFVVRSGPSLERLKIVPAEARLKCGRRFLVGYVGVMGKQEGIDYLLRAVRHIVHGLGRSDVQFGLVGGGTSLDEMKAYAVELGVADFVTFTGRVPDEELLAMLSTADVCVNPDIANDMNDKSTMNKVMEYMALGNRSWGSILRRGGTRLNRRPFTRAAMMPWILRPRSSSCWTTRRGVRRWASSGANAWRRNWSGVMRNPNCSPPTMRCGTPPLTRCRRTAPSRSPMTTRSAVCIRP
jgi:glycosyltransferase involved in cell wall biosynthesis